MKHCNECKSNLFDSCNQCGVCGNTDLICEPIVEPKCTILPETISQSKTQMISRDRYEKSIYQQQQLMRCPKCMQYVRASPNGHNYWYCYACSYVMRKEK